jgi:hypothetical protein
MGRVTLTIKVRAMTNINIRVWKTSSILKMEDQYWISPIGLTQSKRNVMI